jgi:hypothetical protein
MGELRRPDESDEASSRREDRVDVGEATEDLVGGIVLAATAAGVRLSPIETEALFRPFSESDAEMLVQIADRCRDGLLQQVATDGSDEGWREVDGVVLPTGWADSYQCLCELDDPPTAFVVIEAVLDPSEPATDPGGADAPSGEQLRPSRANEARDSHGGGVWFVVCVVLAFLMLPGAVLGLVTGNADLVVWAILGSVVFCVMAWGASLPREPPDA